MKVLKKVGLGCLIAIVGIAAILVLGPRETMPDNAVFEFPGLSEDPVEYLEQAEAAFDDLVPTTAKQILWAGEPGIKTDTSIVYIHGFSASSREIRPVPDLVARDLGANLYFTRLAGHGRPGEHLGRVVVGDWIKDFAEALEIGRTIGKKVVLVSASTGGTLIYALLPYDGLFDDVIGTAFISPNFKPRNPAAVLGSLPFARIWAKWIAGTERCWSGKNADHETYWTNCYPPHSIVPMMTIVSATQDVDPVFTQLPALFYFSPDDLVIDTQMTETFVEKWQGPKQVVRVIDLPETDDPYKHVIMGEILSPSQTQRAVTRLTSWISGLQ